MRRKSTSEMCRFVVGSVTKNEEVEDFGAGKPTPVSTTHGGTHGAHGNMTHGPRQTRQHEDKTRQDCPRPGEEEELSERFLYEEYYQRDHYCCTAVRVHPSREGFSHCIYNSICCILSSHTFIGYPGKPCSTGGGFRVATVCKARYSSFARACHRVLNILDLGL